MFSCNLCGLLFTQDNLLNITIKSASCLRMQAVYYLMKCASVRPPNTACVAGSRKVQRCAGLTGFMSCTMRGITIILFCLHNNHTLWHFYPCIWKSVFYANCLTPKQAFCRFFSTGLKYVTDAGFISTSSLLQSEVTDLSCWQRLFHTCTGRAAPW